ncbi:hypothetical protein PUNSTDRAFT_90354 [Punctularia strigosozonata HHB-11173 SS5]|uniref:uncharacterized protein n=1 Tax=Punctularia strigosozonata (strain HHB-11173) TaxID=741275 RepID=UPI0004418049|nr:uncharacterized protein PUNSTDRAFT_90354 [Punctularia strigosozonata HHB-11173 SS5]EIN06645.1 hypothetical protein PUNSTDRAFT_90354 [Punctularia strigosozonata HHB-11173 SS5]
MPPKPSKAAAPPAASGQKKSRPGVTSKPKAKRPLSTEERLKKLFGSLCAQIDGGHFPNAIRTCDKILRLAADDKDALQTKLFLLLHTEQYEAALTLVDSLDKEHGHDFGRAYSLYRLQREDEAESALKQLSDEDDRGALHLEAQLNYRQGNYQSAFDLYNQLLDSAEPQTEEHDDILTNLQAAQQHLDFINAGYLRVLDQLPAATTSQIETAQPPTVGPAPSAAYPTAAAPPAPAPRKTRAKRVPKGVIPGVTPPPDPERWLKKSERSTYTTGRHRSKRGGGATQGAAVLEAPPTQSASQGKSGGKSKKKK